MSNRNYEEQPIKEITMDMVNPDTTRKIHPNSLKNLKPVYHSEHMRAIQKKSVESRLKNKEQRDIMKKTLSMINEISDGLTAQVPKGMDVLKIAMVKAIAENDMAEASRVAAIIAEYEQPKLQRSENINANFDFTDLSDEELAIEMEKLENGNV